MGKYSRPRPDPPAANQVVVGAVRRKLGQFNSSAIVFGDSLMSFSMDYEAFFLRVTEKPALPYQLAFGLDRSSWITLSVPTGLGKTDAVLISWLYRTITEPASTPRRLAWCLPGRMLTQQAVRVIKERIVAAGLSDQVSVLELMGGSDDNEVVLAPDARAVLVGTQDILLSRALNRGYARKPFRWPLDFALLNNDCQWVLDEVQLLGDGLATSTQLAAFRGMFGGFGRNESVWISATVDPSWLSTVDVVESGLEFSTNVLQKRDHENEIVGRRISARKTLTRAPNKCRTPAGLAQFVSEKHAAGTLSLAVVNTVARARETWTEIRKAHPDTVLLHSRFRPPDRAAIPSSGIVVATQVIEAGIDISARFMVTDLAPYSSLVQRFGRVNRYGDDLGEIFWVDRPLTSKRAEWWDLESLEAKQMEEVCLPYAATEITHAMSTVQSLSSAAPAHLPRVAAKPPWRHVLRRADLLDLFDTTPDLAGNHIDISRFVRLANDSDVYVVWRDWDRGGNGKSAPLLLEVSDEELCPVSLAECRSWAAKRNVYVWDSLEKCWATVEHWYPGMILLAHSNEGGYSREGGWNPTQKAKAPPVDVENPEAEGHADDRLSWRSYRQNLQSHTNDVVREMERLLGAGLAEEFGKELLEAARLHDWGKAHPVMQQTLHNGSPPYVELLAKQRRCDAARGHSRRYFRHELASALAILQSGGSDVVAYLAAAHHGRVRMGLRSMPGERAGDRRIARGVKEGDALLSCDLGDGERTAITLSLECIELGAEGRSWSDRALSLRDQIGVFRLAYLELLLRSADETASENGQESSACA